MNLVYFPKKLYWIHMHTYKKLEVTSNYNLVTVKIPKMAFSVTPYSIYLNRFCFSKVTF